MVFSVKTKSFELENRKHCKGVKWGRPICFIKYQRLFHYYGGNILRVVFHFNFSWGLNFSKTSTRLTSSWLYDWEELSFQNLQKLCIDHTLKHKACKCFCSVWWFNVNLGVIFTEQYVRMVLGKNPQIGSLCDPLGFISHFHLHLLWPF